MSCIRVFDIHHLLRARQFGPLNYAIPPWIDQAILPVQYRIRIIL
jgi:hypothetical protein